MRDTEAEAKAPRHSVSISSRIWNSIFGESGCLTDLMKPVRKESRMEIVSSDLLVLSSRSAAVLSVKETSRLSDLAFSGMRLKSYEEACIGPSGMLCFSKRDLLNGVFSYGRKEPQGRAEGNLGTLSAETPPLPLEPLTARRALDKAEEMQLVSLRRGFRFPEVPIPRAMAAMERLESSASVSAAAMSGKV